MVATRGTAAHLQKNGVDAEVVLKIQEGRPNASDLLKNKDITMMFITSTGKEVDVADGRNLRRLALALKVPIITTMAGANATVQVGALYAAQRSVSVAAFEPCLCSEQLVWILANTTGMLGAPWKCSMFLRVGPSG